jgi:cob(I)alamin adenosyltransferase
MSIIINRVYTGVGDKGTTRLAGGQEVKKTSARIEAYGTLDELNAVLGVVAERLAEEVLGHDHAHAHAHGGAEGEDGVLLGRLRRIQNELFDAGGELAVLPEDRHAAQVLIGEADVRRLEAELDGYNAALPTLRSFILPGGGVLSALLHQARTVARRAERRVLALHELEPQREVLLVYLNRLSDWLFVVGRVAAVRRGHGEVLWRPGDRG